MFLSAKLSPHQIDLRDALSLAEFRGTLPQDTVAIGLQPALVEMGIGLSPLIRTKMDVLLARVVERLEAWGHAAREHAAPLHA